MKIKEIKNYPKINFRLISMMVINDENQVEINYYNSNIEETFEINFKDHITNNTYYSKTYKLHENQNLPEEYNDYLNFLKKHIEIIDWNFEGSKHLIRDNISMDELKKCNI